MTSTTPSLAVRNLFLAIDAHEAALAFYRDAVGLEVTTDVSDGDYRWCTLGTSEQPDLEITLQNIHTLPEATEAEVAALKSLLARGLLTPIIFRTDDVDAVFTRVAASGAPVLQKPTDQFYGVRDCAFSDPSGNMVRFVTELPQG